MGVPLLDDWTDEVVATGDVDGDGIGDLFAVAGAGQHSGVANVVLGGTGEHIGTWAGGDPSDRLLHRCDGLGDLDGDGRGDVALGSPWNDDLQRGRIWVLFDAASPGVHPISEADVVQEGEHDHDQLGHSVAGVGNVVGDDRPDLAVTAVGYDDGTGRLYLFRAQ